MNDRQRDLFLWEWSKRRKRGLWRVTLLGGLIGGLGGLVFALVLMQAPEVGPRHGLSSLIPLLERFFQWIFWSVPPFAVIGMGFAYRTFSRNELWFQLLLDGGAKVPEQRPILQPGDRWPLYVTIAAAILICIGVVVIWVLAGAPRDIPVRPAIDAPPIPAPPRIPPG